MSTFRNHSAKACVSVCVSSLKCAFNAGRSESFKRRKRAYSEFLGCFFVVCLVAHFAAGRTVRLGHRVGSVRCVLHTRTHIHVSLIAAVFCLFVVALAFASHVERASPPHMSLFSYARGAESACFP